MKGKRCGSKIIFIRSSRLLVCSGQTTTDSWRPNRASNMDHTPLLAVRIFQIGTFRDSAGDSDYLRSLFKHYMISGSGAQPCEAGNVTVPRQTSLQLLSERPSTETFRWETCIRSVWILYQSFWGSSRFFKGFLFNTDSNIRNQPLSPRVYSPALGRQSSKPLLRS